MTTSERKIDLYKILDVAPHASMDEVKAAYRKLALLHHPDRKAPQGSIPSGASSTFFQDVNEAYDTLSNSETRTAYDLKTYGMSTFSMSAPTAGAVKDDGYKRMTSEDVNRLMANANSFDRFSTAEYHRNRSVMAPGAIGRRATDFAERKQFRAKAVPLPSKNATIGWLIVPLLAIGLGAFGVNQMWQVLLAVIHVFAVAFLRLGRHLFVVLLEGSKVLAGLRELAFFHALADVPVHEGTLGVHQVELVIDAREDFSDSARVGDHGNSALHAGEVTARDNLDAALETRGAPVNELNRALRLNGRHCSVDVLGDDITAAAMYLPWRGSHLAIIDDGSKHELVISATESCSWYAFSAEITGAYDESINERRDDLCNEAVEVGVRGALNIKRALANVVDGFVVKHNGDIGVLKKRVGREYRVVRLNDGSRDLGRRVDREAKLRLATVVNREAFEEERTETRTARGTCLPAPVSEKKVLKASSPPPMVLSEGIWPSGWMPCSRQ
ncbi:hypothetical protein ACHHYP_03229 [Achlya hypogyna]|uniref:J domain-containing protein n=1 Tax=Achlya hypogyna TaxID=1202772 RepID=A0A1V9Z439_ACHHY|nr:hypothetical protein ACHHYP_03229 [Achlya hypogyna]